MVGAGLLCAGLFYGYILIPLGLRIPCVFYRITGLRCPGCGITDLCLGLLHGRLEPWHNWGLILLLPGLAALAGLHWRGGRPMTEKWLSIALVAFVLVWGGMRNIWGI